MKKTDLVTKIAALVVFLALAAYLGIYFYRAVETPVITAPAVQTTLYTEAQLSGIVVRDETVLSSRADYMSLSVSDGRRVAKGSPVAMTYGSAEAAERAERIRTLETEISRTERLLSGLVSADEVTARETAVKNAVAGLAGATARHAVQEAEEHSLRLESLLLRADAETATAGDLLLMRSELEKLKESAREDTEPVAAPASGIFSTHLDGYEYLRGSDLSGLTPSALREMMDKTEDAPADAIGKLVSSDSWYFAALIDDKDFANVSDVLSRGAYVALQMGRYYGEALSARVEDIGRGEDGGRVVVFSCDRALADTLAMRIVSATLIASEHSGIRVPKEAVRSEVTEDGDILYYLYTRTGVQAEKKYIEIVWETENYYLAAPGPIGSMLRDGNEIIVSAKELYDGKIME